MYLLWEGEKLKVKSKKLKVKSEKVLSFQVSSSDFKSGC